MSCEIRFFFNAVKTLSIFLLIVSSSLARAEYSIEAEVSQSVIQSKDKVNLGSADIRNQAGIAIAPGIFFRKNSKIIYGFSGHLEGNRFLQISGNANRLSELNKLTYGGRVFYDYNLLHRLNLEGRFYLQTKVFPRVSSITNRIDLKDAWIPSLEFAPRYFIANIINFRLLLEANVGMNFPSLFSDIDSKFSLNYGAKFLFMKPQNKWGVKLEYLQQNLDSNFSEDEHKKISLGALLWL